MAYLHPIAFRVLYFFVIISSFHSRFQQLNAAATATKLLPSAITIGEPPLHHHHRLHDRLQNWLRARPQLDNVLNSFSTSSCSLCTSLTHPNAKGIKNKSFPHYDALLEVFSGSRATGEGMATGFDEGAEVLAEDEAEGCNESDFPDDDHLDYLDGISITQPSGEYNHFASTTDPTPTPSPGPSTSSTQKANNNKKAKTNEYVQGLGEVAAGLKEFIASSERQTEIIAEAMLKSASHNPKTANATTIVTELSKISNLNVDDMMMAGMKLLADESLQAMFLAIPEDMRPHFVNKVLGKDV